MMRLSQELSPYRSLEHIANVHRMALYMARQLKRSGVPVDLCLISGAALTHDIGKFGCQKGERVPYLHYFYTDRWCRQQNIPTIGHIAANHSVWDLELENLSAESLLLIYADFRIKQVTDNGVENTRVFTLKESFQVILEKLDNVDSSKRDRYLKVYDKLSDFEDYLRFLGVDTNMDGKELHPCCREASLMTGEEAVASLKLLGVEHNIALMHHFGNERLFGNILEAARTEKNWKNIRAYLGVFDEYFTYLSISQKVQTLAFLYELLMNREGDIRRQAASLLGNIIARFDISYKKELPAGVAEDDDITSLQMWEKYLEMIIHPSYKLTFQHKSWIGFTLKIVISSFFENCDEADRRPFMERLTKWFSSPDKEELVNFYLLDAINYLPLKFCTDKERSRLLTFAMDAAEGSISLLRASALRTLSYIVAIGYPLEQDEVRRLSALCVPCNDQEENTTLRMLKTQIRSCLSESDETELTAVSSDTISDIFLDNLKMATSWVIKTLNVDLLLSVAEQDPHSPYLLHIAAHFANLLKVSERVVVRHKAGAALLHIAPLLSYDQRNEIAVELLQGLEVGEYEFSKYIPEYLGQFALWLSTEELEELILQLNDLVYSPNTNVVAVAIATIGVLMECLNNRRDNFGETHQMQERRREYLLGILLKGLVGRDAARQESMLIIGQHFFASRKLADDDKRQLFGKCCKKLLSLISEYREGKLEFFYRAAVLNNIYRFISDSQLNHGEFVIEQFDKVAFFPGTFDPFSNSHKGIVEEMLQQGFEVMLAIDEYSWSKKTQPHFIRHQLANMTLADKFHVYVYPGSMPVNIANPQDLAMLRHSLPERHIYIVAGSDVVANATAYKEPPQPDSIHSFDHIIFPRTEGEDIAAVIDMAALSRIKGEVISLSLPVYLENVSSTNIREDIDNNRDISNLVDPMVQEFIYNNNLYLREPQYKQLPNVRQAEVERWTSANPADVQRLLNKLLPERGEANRATAVALSKRGSEFFLLKDDSQEASPVGMISLHEVQISELMPLLGNTHLADKVRQRQAGRVLLITGIYMSKDSWDNSQLLCTEVFGSALRNGCTHAMFYPIDTAGNCNYVLELLKRQGFVVLEDNDPRQPLYITDLRAPLVLLRNIETSMKAPFANLPSVLKAAQGAHWRLQTAMAGLKPGHLVLSVDSNIMQEKLIRRITELNGVPAKPVEPPQFGPLMCVPFSKLLRRSIVPNTVTKTVHTDKVFEPDISKFSIEAYPNYLPLEYQIRTIKSFMRPVIMVTDMLQSGHRLRTLSPIFNQQGIEIHAVLAGILSGRGRDVVSTQGYRVECIYFVPNLHGWCIESTLYPFIGGDTVRRNESPKANLLPAVNLILPYASIRIFNQFPRKAVYDYSLACMENARDIMQVLEQEYAARFGRNLTLNRLSEVIHLPLLPDKGKYMQYDYNLTASVYIKNDIELLLRLSNQFR